MVWLLLTKQSCLVVKKFRLIRRRHTSFDGLLLLLLQVSELLSSATIAQVRQIRLL